MNEELYITFENYFNNEMSQEEQLEFENQLQNDADMQQKFEIYKDTNKFLETKFSSETAAFKQNLEAISKEHFAEKVEKKTKVIAFKPWQYAVAASVAILVGSWFYMQNNIPQYGDYSSPETAMFVERSVGDANLKEAQNAFNAKDYKKATASFEKVTDLKNPELQYFYAISLIETNNYAKAEVLLNNIKSGTSVYKDKATWYLALSNLKQKKLQDCKTYLKQLPADSEDYDKAQELLKKLD
jgi:predicted Zn-dependent protease